MRASGNEDELIKYKAGFQYRDSVNYPAGRAFPKSKFSNANSAKRAKHANFLRFHLHCIERSEMQVSPPSRRSRFNIADWSSYFEKRMIPQAIQRKRARLRKAVSIACIIYLKLLEEWSMPRSNLSSEELMLAELNYISQTAFQANEDRARVTSFYLVAVGSLVAALFSTQFFNEKFDPQLTALAFSGLFFVLTLLGTLTTLQLSRLRAAWYDSMLAMDQLKEHWLRQSHDKALKNAFRWDMSTLPPKYKLNSVSHYQTLEVALLSGITFGASVFFLQRGVRYDCFACNWAYTISLGVLAFVFQLWIYKRNLD